MSRGTPSRTASRRSASRKTVASTRSTVAAAAVLPGRHIRALKSGASANNHRSCRRHETAADLSLRDGFRDTRRLAFTARCARRRPASLSPAVRSADGRREPAGDGPLDLACADVRRHPRPEANGARRRRFAPDVRVARLPNRLVAVVRMTPGGGRPVSTGAAGRGCHASRPRTATAGSRGPSFRGSRSGSNPSSPHCRISERHWS